LIKGLIIAGSLIAMSNAQARGMAEINPFMGFDYKQTQIHGNGDWGFLPDHYPGLSFYAGSRFHTYFGVEAGYDQSFFNSNDAGTASTLWNTSAVGLTVYSKVRFEGGHIDLNGYWPIEEDLELIGGIGWASMKAHMQISSMQNTTLAEALKSTQGRHSSIARAKVGLQYKISDHLGISGRVLWEGTKALKVRGSQGFVNLGIDEKPFKSSFSGLLGLFVTY